MRDLSGDLIFLAERPFWPKGLEALSPAVAKQKVPGKAGAFSRDRESIDQRIVHDAAKGTGKNIYSENF
jgi:hypothetical protein